MKPIVPTDREIFEGEIADYWFEEGILVSLSKSPRRTIENISGNIALVKRITGNKPVPLLIYLSNSPVPDKETRKFSTEQLTVIYSAMAMVSKPGLARFIMNILFALKPPPIPMKSFTHERQARIWLRQFLWNIFQSAPPIYAHDRTNLSPYSVLRLFAGLARPARMACMLTTKTVSNNAPIPVAAKVHQYNCVW